MGMKTGIWVQCDECPGRRLKQCYLRRHWELKHRNLPPAQIKESRVCEDCGSVVPGSRTDLFRHWATHHQSREFMSASCDACHGRSFPNRYLLTRHIRNVHTEDERRLYVCDECAATFKCRLGLRKHWRAHDEGRWRTESWRCDVCSALLHRKDAAVYHSRRHLRLPGHASSKASVFCDCHGQAFTPGTLVKHFHRRKPSEFLCDSCDFSTVHKAQFSLHLQREHRLELWAADEPAGLFVCDECGARLTWLTGITAHLANAHGLTVGRHNNYANASYKCECHSKIFGLKQGLTNHVAGGRTLRTFTCDHCNLQFVGEYRKFSAHLRASHFFIPTLNSLM